MWNTLFDWRKPPDCNHRKFDAAKRIKRVFGHWISLQRHPRRPTVRAERATRWVRQVAGWRNAAAPTATAAGRKLSWKAGHVRLPVAVRVYGQKLVGIHLRLHAEKTADHFENRPETEPPVQEHFGADNHGRGLAFHEVTDLIAIYISYTPSYQLPLPRYPIRNENILPYDIMYFRPFFISIIWHYTVCTNSHVTVNMMGAPWQFDIAGSFQLNVYFMIVISTNGV